MTLAHRRRNAAQYDENQNWPKLTFKRPATANVSRIFKNRYDIRNQRIKLHQKKCGERNFAKKKIKKGSPYYANFQRNTSSGSVTILEKLMAGLHQSTCTAEIEIFFLPFVTFKNNIPQISGKIATSSGVLHVR